MERQPNTPQFPITVRWHDTGELEELRNEVEIIQNIEDWDTRDPACQGEATIRDALGRPVGLRTQIWTGLVEVWLEPGSPGDT